MISGVLTATYALANKMTHCLISLVVCFGCVVILLAIANGIDAKRSTEVVVSTESTAQAEEQEAQEAKFCTACGTDLNKQKVVRYCPVCGFEF